MAMVSKETWDEEGKKNVRDSDVLERCIIVL